MKAHNINEWVKIVRHALPDIGCDTNDEIRFVLSSRCFSRNGVHINRSRLNNFPFIFRFEILSLIDLKSIKVGTMLHPRS